MRKKQMGDIARETLGSCVKQSGQQPASAQAAAEPPPRSVCLEVRVAVWLLPDR